MQQWTIGSGDVGVRLDKYLAGADRLVSHGRALTALERGKIFVNDREVTPADAGTRLAVGDLCYITDPRACDRWCAPAETLRRGGGDCDDFAILGVSLLRALGVPAFVIVGRTCDGSGCAWHAWVEGRDRRGRFHLEATSGALVRGPWRPAGYHADLVLGPGVCVRAA